MKRLTTRLYVGPMKPSGVDWIGDIPVSWTKGMVKKNYQLQLGKMLQPEASGPQDQLIPYLRSANIQDSYISTGDLKYMYASSVEAQKYAVQAGDLLITEGGDVGRSAIAGLEQQGMILQNSVHRVRSPQGTTRMLHHTMRYLKEIGHIAELCNASTIMHFTAEKLKNLEIPQPPIASQELIGEYLEQQVSQLQQLEASANQLQVRRDELLWPVITGKVTVERLPDGSFRTREAAAAGIRLKPSGVEWIGEIPVHWEVKRLKQLANSQSGTAFPNEEQRNIVGNISFLKVENLEDGLQQDRGSINRVDDAIAKRLRARVLDPGTIVIAKIGMAIMKNRVMNLTTQACIDNNMMAIIPKDITQGKWLSYCLKCINFQSIAEPGAVPSIRTSRVNSIALPTPSQAEIKNIAAYFQQQDDAIQAMRRAVALQHERLSILTEQCITGKLEVIEVDE